MFTEEFRNRLAFGKYTKWALSLTPDELLGLLWAFDEYACRLPPRGDDLQRMLDGFRQSELHIRALTGLRIVLEFAAGHRCTKDEVREEIRAAVMEFERSSREVRE